MYSLSDYNFTLLEKYISQAPAKVRDQSRLLVLDRKSGALSHKKFHEIKRLLSPGDVLVINNTRVVPARLFGRKKTGGKVEVLILDYAKGIENLKKSGEFESPCLIKASKAPKPGTQLDFQQGMTGMVTVVEDGTFSIRFSCDDNFEHILDRIGQVPLPPYIKREGAENKSCDDRTSYQTVYAREDGAIAAPTAGLHFTSQLLEDLASKGIIITTITLHVGYGTFLPIRVGDIRDHTIHSEFYSISKETADIVNGARQKRGRIVAVGTTSVRTLEYVSDKEGNIKEGNGSCDLFIYPGYKFKIIDAMITNFHLPKSTLLMLVSAFAGRENILNAYKEAIKEKYRFYSYGDAMYIG